MQMLMLRGIHLLKELRNYNGKLRFRRKHNQHFKLQSFKTNLHFGTSNLVCTLRTLKFRLINSIYLVFPSLKIQKRFIQIKV